MGNNRIQIPHSIVPAYPVYESPVSDTQGMQTYTWRHRIHSHGGEGYRQKTTGSDLHDAFRADLELARNGTWQYGFQYYNVKTIGDSWHDRHARSFGRITPTFIVGTKSMAIGELLAMSESNLWDIAKESDRPYLLLDAIGQIQKDQLREHHSFNIILLCSDNVWRLVEENHCGENNPNNNYPIVVPKEGNISIEYI